MVNSLHTLNYPIFISIKCSIIHIEHIKTKIPLNWRTELKNYQHKNNKNNKYHVMLSMNNTDPKNITKITSNDFYWHIINSTEHIPNVKKK